MKRFARPRRACWQFCIAGLLISGTASAELIPLNQVRTIDTVANVSSSAFPDHDADHAAAADFAPFLQSIQSSASSGGTSALSHASQDSQILTSGLIAVGACDSRASGGNDAAQSNSNSRSFFSLTFELTAPGSVSGTLTRQTQGLLGSSEVEMSIPGIGSWIADIVHPSTSVSANLPAGNYALTIEATSTAFSTNFENCFGQATFDIRVVPEPSTLLLLGLSAGLLRRRQ